MASTFLGLSLTPFGLEQKARLEPFLAAHPQPLSGYTFATFIAWQEAFNYAWGFVDETLLVSFEAPPDRHRQLIQPIGPLSKPLEERLLGVARELAYPLKIIGASREFIADHADFAKAFDIAADEASSNYIYSAEKLELLPGRDYSAKRNLISQATRQYRWTVEPLTGVNIAACSDVLRETDLDDPEPHEWVRQQERRALERTLANFEALGQRGVLIRVDGAPAAFCIWEPQTPEMAVIHFERAIRRYKGVYQLVNREAARDIRAAGFALINREEDLGDLGLRKAKRSYNPIWLNEAHQLTLKR